MKFTFKVVNLYFRHILEECALKKSCFLLLNYMNFHCIHIAIEMANFDKKYFLTGA